MSNHTFNSTLATRAIVAITSQLGERWCDILDLQLNVAKGRTPAAFSIIVTSDLEPHNEDNFSNVSSILSWIYFSFQREEEQPEPVQLISSRVAGLDQSAASWDV